MSTTLIQSEITTLNNDIDIIEAKLKKLKAQKRFEEEMYGVFNKGGTPKKLRMILDMCKECDFNKNRKYKIKTGMPGYRENIYL